MVIMKIKGNSIILYLKLKAKSIKFELKEEGNLLNLLEKYIDAIISKFNFRNENKKIEEDYKVDIEKSLNHATKQGFTSGFEPYILDKINITKHKLMFGSPGFGLDESNFSNAQIDLGKKGELNLAKAFEKSGYLDKFATFWSLNNINENNEKMEADIDCVLISKNTIWLIDAKYYASGDVYYKSDDDYFYVIDKETDMTIGNKRKMSGNMKLAVESFKKRYSEVLKGFEVKACICLIPTNMKTSNVYNVKWKGDIDVYSLFQLIRNELNKEEAIDIYNYRTRITVDSIKSLVKI